jgi:hypothetical protein
VISPVGLAAAQADSSHRGLSAPVIKKYKKYMKSHFLIDAGREFGQADLINRTRGAGRWFAGIRSATLHFIF